MKRILLLLGVILHAIYYIPALLSLFATNGFDLWVLAMVLSFPVIVIYLIDAIKALKMHHTKFDVFRLVIIIVSFLLCVGVGCTLGTVYSIIWNLYFLFIFIIQLLSLFIKRIEK